MWVTASFPRRKAITAENDWAEEILHTEGFTGGIDPIGINFIRTFSTGKGGDTGVSVGVGITCSLAELAELSSLSPNPICDSLRV